MDIKEIFQLAQRYDKATNSLEDKTIERVERILKNSFDNLRSSLENLANVAKDYSILERNFFLIKQITPLIKITDETSYQDFLRKTSQQGVFFASQIASVPFIDVPIEAVAFQAAESYNRLLRHGEEFANNATNTIGMGITQGWSVKRTAQALIVGQDILKSRAEMIVRTESIKAFSNAAQSRYLEADIDEVLWLTVKEGACKYCQWRNGKTFKIGSVIHPAHPNDRCVLIPVVVSNELSGDFWKDYPNYIGDNPGVAPFEKSAGFTEINYLQNFRANN